jgi:thymidylate synthase
MNKLDLDYQNLLKDILENGVKKNTRNGEVLSIFGRQIRHKMSDGFPLLTTKKMPFKTIVTELLWFLRGDTNIKYLVDNGCHIWDGDAYKNYEKWFWDNIPPKADTSGKLSQEEFINKIETDDEFAKKWGELGPIYGEQWRSWDWDLNPEPIDQIQNLINDLKTNPDSRRLMVSAWNVGALESMVLPPCHYGFQVYTREMTLEERLEWNYNNSDPLNRSMDYFPEHLDTIGVPKRKISLMWNQRSVDTFLGLPFNIASYGLLLEIIAKEVNMVPDELVGNLGDTHLYLNHITQAKEQVKREPYSLPKLELSRTLFEFGKPNPNKLDLDYYSIHNFKLLNYHSHPTIKAPLSN